MSQTKDADRPPVHAVVLLPCPFCGVNPTPDDVLANVWYVDHREGCWIRGRTDLPWNIVSKTTATEWNARMASRGAE